MQQIVIVFTVSVCVKLFFSVYFLLTLNMPYHVNILLTTIFNDNLNIAEVIVAKIQIRFYSLKA